MKKIKTIYRAVSPDDHQCEGQRWVSLDGESWLPVAFDNDWDEWKNEFDAAYNAVHNLFHPKGKGYMPMTFATRYVTFDDKAHGKQFGAAATIIDPIRESDSWVAGGFLKIEDQT